MLPERYVPRKIAKISKTDKKVSIIGKVEEKTDDSFFLDDGSGKIEIFFEKENSEGGEGRAQSREKNEGGKTKAEDGKIMRAFCSVVGDRLKLDVAQSLDSLDLNLLKTVDDLYEKAGV